MDIAQVLKREGKWYIVGDSKAEVLIKVATPKKLRDLLRRFSGKKKVQGQIIDDYNWDQINYGLLHATVLDWKNIEQDGGSLEVNEENRRLLFDNWPEFNALCNAVWDVSKTTENAEKEADLGNLSNGQDSSLPDTTE